MERFVRVLAEGEQPGVGQGLPTGAPADSARKIIYEANLELVVEDFDGVSDRVVGLARQFGGYVAASDRHGSTGENRRATWTLRVPIDHYDAFVAAAKGLGEPLRVGTTSRDVSEEYYDVEARIRNKTKEEERLLALLEERPGKLEDVIAIERELSRVREELERMQGRMRVLTDLTALTTVTLLVHEVRGYQPAEAPSLATRTRRAFEGSLAGLRDAGESLWLVAVTAIPWVPVGALILAPATWLARRFRRLRSARLAA